MKGKRSTYIGCVCLIMVIAGLTGCISGEVKTDDRGNYDQERSSNDQERSSNISDPAGDYDHSNIADWMDITSESDKEFYIMRVRGDYFEIPGTCLSVFDGNGGYPDLEEGEIARVVADVDIYDGGVAGYMGNSFIKELKDVEKLEYRDAIDTLNIPDITEGDFEYAKKLLKYEDENGVYLIVPNQEYVDIYLNGSFFDKYELKKDGDDTQRFFEILAGETEIQ